MIPDMSVADLVTAQLAEALSVAPDQIRPEQRLPHLPNADSLRLLVAISATTRELGVQVDEAELLTARTVADLIGVFERARQA